MRYAFLQNTQNNKSQDTHTKLQHHRQSLSLLYHQEAVDEEGGWVTAVLAYTLGWLACFRLGGV